MSHLFFAPVSSFYIDFNFMKTVVNKVDTSTLKNTSELKKYGFDKSLVSLWGVKNIKLKSFKKAKTKDYVCFYKKGSIIGYSEILNKFKDTELSQELWGVYSHPHRDYDEYWENILVLSSYKNILIPFKLFNYLSGYAENYSVRSFMPLNQKGFEDIIIKHGSVINLLKKFKI